jgi:NADH dehydrogenase
VPTDLVTGAFSFTGGQIAARLLARGRAVRTLTGHPQRAHPLRERVEPFAYSFDDPAALTRALEGVDTFYNTYWVRFAHGGATYEAGVRNTRALFRAAREAGVRRVVHVSIANPASDSPLAYYRGKWELERELRESGLAHAILRPTVVFGEGGILINNIAWLLHRLPVFVVPGDGSYHLQPVFVEDLAELAVEAGAADEDLVWDAAGPECFTYLELVRRIRTAVGGRCLLLRAPASVALALGRVLGWLLRDVLITRDEIEGLMADLLVSHEPARCRTRLGEWLERNRERVGRHYLSELALHYR